LKECNSCGKCCIKYGGDGGLSASKVDLEMWELFRPDIFSYVKGGELWFDPESGRQLAACPWLKHESDNNKYSCAIYDDRPEDCRHYPSRIEEMITDACEMIEVQDLRNSKKAQSSLDKLMADSRPPYA